MKNGHQSPSKQLQIACLVGSPNPKDIYSNIKQGKEANPDFCEAATKKNLVLPQMVTQINCFWGFEVEKFHIFLFFLNKGLC